MKPNLKIAILGGQYAPHYTIGLLSGLLPHDIEIDVIGNPELRQYDIFKHPQITYREIRGAANPDDGLLKKIWRVLRFYWRLMKYAVSTEITIFHIQWFDKLEKFEKAIFVLLYKLLGKKIVFTAHNINAGKRDSTDSWLNQLTLRFSYRLIDHIIVHSEKMRSELEDEFGIPSRKISVIGHGIMDHVPVTTLGNDEARRRLSLEHEHKVLLFFGLIAPYKGLDILIEALSSLVVSMPEVRLLVAGAVKEASPGYWTQVENAIEKYRLREYLKLNPSFIPDHEIEFYFKAADVLILPYRNIFQSGVAFLSYHFGLPIIASDVGSLPEIIAEGKTGYICRPENPEDLAAKIKLFFESDLYRNQAERAEYIREYANSRFSWRSIGSETVGLYQALQSGPSSKI